MYEKNSSSAIPPEGSNKEKTLLINKPINGLLTEDNIEDERYRCCWGRVHVETATRGIAMFHICLMAAVFILTIAVESGRSNHPSNYLPSQLITMLLVSTIYIAIFVAQRKRIPGLYWPFLIFNGLGVAIGCLTLLLFCVVIVLSQFPMEFMPWLAFCLVLMVGGVSLNAWFESVVYSAFQFMRQQEQLPSTYQIPNQKGVV
ncbi:hypothetical protein Ddc_07224 [Ditylenchus destructor]|nr:hypothetical protein Ddc_07224 [Ditylenchus destructor]